MQWPENFGRRFLVTVDTEEEFDWDAPFERTGHTTITVPKLQRFQQFVGKYGVKPLYFVDYSIVQDDAAVSFLKSVIEEDSATVGIHLHPWVNPPFEEQLNDRNSFAGNLPIELEEQKLEILCKTLTERVGIKSPFYRAGRYGIGEHTTEILRRHGFTMDSSIRSRFDYSDEGGPNFQDIGPEPFWWQGDRRLLEVPLTTVYSGMFRKQAGLFGKMMNSSGIANAIISRSKMLERIPLTPEGVTAWEAKEAIDVALDDQLQLLVFSFHSPSLSPGHTPYVRTDEDLDRFYDWWRDVIEHLEMRGASPISAEEILAAAG